VTGDGKMYNKEVLTKSKNKQREWHLPSYLKNTLDKFPHGRAFPVFKWMKKKEFQDSSPLSYIIN
jgi:hypothetical protein